MARKMIEIVADFNIFLRGVGQIGLVHKVSVPNLTQIKEPHTSGAGDYEISIGQFEKMEASFTIYDENILLYLESANLNDAELDFVEAVKAGSEAREGNYEFKGILDLESSDSERKGKKEMVGKMSCNRAFHSINGDEAYHIDFENNIAKVGGIDHLEKVRRIIGG